MTPGVDIPWEIVYKETVWELSSGTVVDSRYGDSLVVSAGRESVLGQRLGRPRLAVIFASFLARFLGGTVSDKCMVGKGLSAASTSAAGGAESEGTADQSVKSMGGNEL